MENIKRHEKRRIKEYIIRMENKMKYLRKLAKILILLIFVFMGIALFQFEREEEIHPLLSNQMEFYFNEKWRMVSIDGTKISEAERENHDIIQERIKTALAEGKSQEVNLPYAGKSKAGDIIVFKNTLPKEYAGMILNFSTTDTIVCVVLDGEVIYQYGTLDDEVHEKWSRTKENFVNIPDIYQNGEIWIELTSSRPDMAAALSDIKVETKNTIVIGVVENNITDIVCCLLIIIMAIIMFVLELIRRYTHQPTRGELFLGCAGFALGIYCFIRTDTLSIFYNIYEVYEIQEYLVILFPLLLALYFEQNLYMIYPYRFSVLLGCVSINAIAQILLQMLGIQNVEDIAKVSAIMIGFICVITIVSLIQFDYKNKRYQALLSVLAMFVLLLGGMANMIISIIFQDTYGNTIGKYSMTVFSIMMTVIHILQLSKEYQAKAEENARLLEEKVKVTEQQNIQLTQAKQDADIARHEALAANESKGKFLAHMSHEIRTPINAVLGMDEMILRESKEQNIKEYAMDIYTAGQTLLSLINDILDFSKIDSGKMEIVPVEYDISSLIHDLANMTSQRAEDKNIKLEVEVDHEIPSRLYGDDVRIRQILTNILTNAVKYTHEGMVWLRVQCNKIDETAVLKFEVEDTGIGIKEEDLPKLSAEFERIEEDRNRNIEGSGLGMNITIQLLELLGSRLLVESIYGKGTKFYFELKQKIIDHTPIGDFESRVHQMAENYNYNTKFYAPDAKILIVDDNAVNRKVLRNLLKETQIQVTDVERGLECLELVQKNHYDLIFLDHMMPEMDGIETLHHIKELSDYPCQNTPIIVLTANAVSGAKEKYLSEGFDDFLSKPVVPEKLENMIKKMLPEELLLETVINEPKTVLQQPETSISEDFLEELPQVDGLDWHYAWLHLPDMELLEYTIKEFYAQIDSAADNLERFYEQIAEPKQLEQYRIQVHAMKSLAATVGIIPLAGIAKILEYAARDGKIDVIISITTAFLEEWRSYREKLRGVFGIETVAKKEVIDYSVIQALVEMLRICMQEMDIDQADQLVGQLQAYEYPDEMSQNIRKLKEAVTNLDSEEADHLADLLIGQMEKKISD